MNYEETCEYLYSQMPMFERQGASGYKEGLANTLALDEHLGHPHRAYATIHVGGTNGKGSCSHTIAAILQECGYRVGLYTSPHLVDFRERIRVNGKPVSEEYVVDFVSRERAFFEPLHPSFFEVTTALAFQYFKDSNIDIAVVEVGLGGRLDCTNIITPIVSVITNISFDHTQFLGDTLAKIAAEKAGIIKHGVPVIIGESNSETRPVFEARAKDMDAPIVFAEDEPEVVSAEVRAEGGMHYRTRHMGELDGDLGGIYQQKNMNTVLYAMGAVARLGYLSISSDSRNNVEKCSYEVSEAIRHVAEKTGLMGRWQTVQTTPRVICDTGHNVGGWQYISRQLQQTPCQQLHIIFGMVDDKDVDGVLELLPKQATYYYTKASTHRAVNESDLQQKAAQHGLKGASYPTVAEAYKAAMAVATRNDLVFVGGSSYVVGDFLKSCN
ncbi:MAG: bifunctional folylpolyglutamate synthase/dihydrofolate synthase [Prevotella sp.]|nr:bifunctional folylpolyglutamate synthase/dihydrofolate synthase [Prevotella sp.]